MEKLNRVGITTMVNSNATYVFIHFSLVHQYNLKMSKYLSYSKTINMKVVEIVKIAYNIVVIVGC